MKSQYVLLFCSLSLIACNNDHTSPKNKSEVVSLQKIIINDSIRDSLPAQISVVYSSAEQKIIDAGLTDIKTLDSNIVVDLKYSTTDNFLGINVYGTFNKCYLQPDVAQKLKLAQQFLRAEFPYYNLVIYDGVRPRSIQYKMWGTINIPIAERTKYLSNPKNGSLHNFGAAVDISIIDENGYAIDMGTKYDYFGELAYPREEERMIREGKLSRMQLLNRELLRKVMTESGFMGITTEWWHFNSCSRNEAFFKYKIIE